MDQATLIALGAYTGLIGGLAGIASLAWTVLWAVTLRPRARWSLNRFDVQPPTVFAPPRPLPDGTIPPTPTPVRIDPPLLRFYFRNTGTAAADDAHAIVAGGMWATPVEFPATGRERLEPGQEITVRVQAKSISDQLAGRPYPSGDDTVFDLANVTVKVSWRRQTWGFARRRFDLNKEQLKVPFR